MLVEKRRSVHLCQSWNAEGHSHPNSVKWFNEKEKSMHVLYEMTEDFRTKFYGKD